MKIKNIHLFLMLIAFSGCTVWGNLVLLEQSSLHERHYTNYINSGAEYKILFQTKKPVPIYAWSESEWVETSVVKSYASTDQKSYEYAIAEAYEYCKRDNREKAEQICELKMIGYFDATETEKIYATVLIQGNFLQVTIRNNKSNDCGYNRNFKEFEWWKCKTAVRVNPENYFNKPATPIQENRKEQRTI